MSDNYFLLIKKKSNQESLGWPNSRQIYFGFIYVLSLCFEQWCTYKPPKKKMQFYYKTNTIIKCNIS